ncbi:MAG: hypothetical protein HQL72_03725 [Magnetococcales bacterium]|nr:hypothetical protein [Magnetococcales bacterium]
MAASQKKIQANRKNATLSTGPKTEAGKARSSMNAVRHGLFSQHLFLDDEYSDDYQALEEDLHHTLRPVGALEQTLVERIAVNMWRQRRLVQAETSMLDLERTPQKIAKSASRELGRAWDNELKEDELLPFDSKQADWCQGAVDELESLSDITLEALSKEAPSIHQQLVEEAEGDEETLEEYLANYDNGLQEYVIDLVRWCREELDKANQRPRILVTAQKVRGKKVILPEKYLELMTRYQTSLDNQLYKAMKAFREAQEWRLQTMEGEAVPAIENPPEAVLNVVQ